ncbi:tRNA (adenosine(37)-N6)-threonylcarbamoyltransferase complex ATPase subunit type 1 TsaE [Patescibacteria group bacterium]|nr:tRNA (adenosine(37)-N6)-threonylcarbamoyltransferase complex ATPase subunit type 1 TsaE [Patescibacteria group bacterium]MBU1876823.1 tRNA (adenosine(37)-N6)-threonylcarbamoyltransferase complex ATPase subunit type 1 TsaE [Patescibacteria group bacterium]
MKKNYLTNSAAETKRIASEMARQILSCKPKKKAFLIGLVGDLGGGKTTFTQGLAKGLGVKDKILSPTFVIMKKFKIKHPRFQYFYHFDCYRFLKNKDILDLDFKKIINNPGNIVAMEWADKIKNVLPKTTTWINFDFVDNKKRKIMIK